MNSLRVIVLLASLLVATSLAADVIYELPLQGCSGILVPLETDHILVNFNGSRMAFHTSDSATGAFDTSSALYFQWTDIREMVRGTQGVNADIDSSVNIQALSGCFCSFSAISRISDGIEETGVETTLTRCPNNPTLVAKAFVTVSNDTWFETYGPTMEGSSIEYFNYTHPYVKDQKRSHFRFWHISLFFFFFLGGNSQRSSRAPTQHHRLLSPTMT